MRESGRTQLVNLQEAPLDEAAALAGRILREGGLVAFPTETVYGLGANALNPAAVTAIFDAKGRPSNNPVIVHVPDAEAAQALVQQWTEPAARLAEAFWPGPITLVLLKRDLVPDVVTGGGPTVAVRVPAHAVAAALLRAAGVPVAAPSANRSTEISPTTAAHVAQGLDGRIDLILDGGPTSGGIESTVVALLDDRPVLMRPGLITRAQIEQVIGPIELARRAAPDELSRDPRPLASPGMLARHYAPRTPLEVVEPGERRVHELLRAEASVGWITRMAPRHALAPEPRLKRVQLPDDATGFAAQLYAALHEMDAAGLDRIVVDAVPEGDEWSAVRDRLQRASTM